MLRVVVRVVILLIPLGSVLPMITVLTLEKARPCIELRYLRKQLLIPHVGTMTETPGTVSFHPVVPTHHPSSNSASPDPEKYIPDHHTFSVYRETRRVRVARRPAVCEEKQAVLRGYVRLVRDEEVLLLDHCPYDPTLRMH